MSCIWTAVIKSKCFTAFTQKHKHLLYPLKLPAPLHAAANLHLNLENVTNWYRTLSDLLHYSHCTINSPSIHPAHKRCHRYQTNQCGPAILHKSLIVCPFRFRILFMILVIMFRALRGQGVLSVPCFGLKTKGECVSEVVDLWTLSTPEIIDTDPFVNICFYVFVLFRLLPVVSF